MSIATRRRRLVQPSVPLEGYPLSWSAARIKPAERDGKPWERVSAPGEVHNVPTGAVLLARRAAQGVTRTALAKAAALRLCDVRAVETGADLRVALRQRLSDALHVLSLAERARKEP